MELTKTEKKALLACLRNPSANPRELADFMDMSYWTLIKTRKRLMERGIMSFVWLPNLKKIGAKIIFSGFGTLKKEEETPEVSSDFLFLTVVEDRKGFGIGISTDYSSLYRELMKFSEKYGYMGAEKFGLTIIPMDIADIWRFADFYPLLSHDLGMEVPLLEHKSEKKEGDGWVRDFERDVFASIIEHPEWTGDMIARELGTTRQRVLRLREKFEAEGLLQRKAIVNLRALGYEVLLFVTWTMKPHIYRKMSENISRYPLSPIILGISTPIHGIAVAVFRNFRESREIIEHLYTWANPDENLIGEPEMMFFSIQDSVFPRYFEFSDAVKRILKIKRR